MSTAPERGLRGRLMLLVGLAVVPALAILVVDGLRARSSAREEAAEDAVTIAREIAADQSRYLDDTRQLLITLNQVPDIRRPHSRGCDALVTSLVQRSPVYLDVGVATRGGAVVCSAVRRNAPLDIGDRDYFRAAIPRRRFAVGSFEVGGLVDEPALATAYPILHNGRVEGVMYAALDVGSLNEVAARASLPRGSALTIFDSSGTVFAHYPEPQLSVGLSFAQAPLVEAARAGEGTREVEGIDSRVRLYAFSPIGQDTGAFAAVGIPLDAAYAPAAAALRSSLVTMAVVAAIALGGAYWVGNRLVVRQVTRRRQAIEARANLAAIIESSDDAIIGTDLSGTITSWNAAAERIYGYTASQAVGQSLAMLVPPERREAVPATLATLAKGRRIEPFVTTGVCADGRVIDVSVSLSPVVGEDGEVVGGATISRDVSVEREATRTLHAALESEREAAQRLKQLDEMKNEFVGIVAHDVRSPLAVTQGYIDTVRRGWSTIPDDLKLQYLDTATRSVHSVGDLLEDVLQVTRIESGLEFNVGEVDIGARAERTIEELRVAHPARRIELELEPGLPMARADEQRQWQILVNLVTNAIKFSDDDSAVEVAVARDGNMLRVSVVDHGIGIPEDELGKVFVKFSRIHQPGRRNRTKGTGLGLYICKSLVEAQGGRIDVQSVEGQGSTFTYTVPIAGMRVDG